MKLLFLLVIYDLQGRISSEETTLDPRTGDSGAPSPWFEDFTQECFPCSKIEPSNLQPPTSGSGDSFSSIEVYTSRDTDGMSEETPPYACEAGPSWAEPWWASQGPNYQDVPPASVDRRKKEQCAEKCLPQEKFPCKVCGKSFIFKRNMKRHMKTHSNDKPFICKICDTSFRWNGNLIRHMQTHDDERIFSCELCRKSFKRKCHLENHMRTHTDERFFLCELCTKSFVRQSDLTNHLRTHNDVRRFPCRLCGMSFNLNTVLTKHVSNHGNERRFCCEICGKRYKTSFDLMRHKNTCMDKSPFVCKMCRKSFKYGGVYKRHMEMHKNIESEGELFPCTLGIRNFNAVDDPRNHMIIHEASQVVNEAQENDGTTGENRWDMSNQLTQIEREFRGKYSYSNGAENPAASSDLLSAVYEDPGVVPTGHEIMRQAVEVALGLPCDDGNALLLLIAEESDLSTEQTTRSISESSE